MSSPWPIVSWLVATAFVLIKGIQAVRDFVIWYRRVGPSPPSGSGFRPCGVNSDPWASTCRP